MTNCDFQIRTADPIVTTVAPADASPTTLCCRGPILRFNLSQVKNVALVPSSHVIRKNAFHAEDQSS
jgi:hypothetical protein